MYGLTLLYGRVPEENPDPGDFLSHEQTARQRADGGSGFRLQESDRLRRQGVGVYQLGTVRAGLSPAS